MGLPSIFKTIVSIISILAGLTIFYFISRKSWQVAGLFGIGLSSALSLILFFIATNISHDQIKIGYFDFLFAIAMSALVYIYLKSNIQIKALTLIFFMILNGLMIFLFDRSMVKLDYESQLLYLMIFSNALLFSGIVFHYLVQLTVKTINR